MSAFELSAAFRVNHRLLQEEPTIIEAKSLFTDWTNHLARKCRFAGEEWKIRSEGQQVCCLTSNGAHDAKCRFRFMLYRQCSVYLSRRLD